MLEGAEVRHPVEHRLLRSRGRRQHLTCPAILAHIQTLVAVREGDEWRFTAFHNSRVRPIGGGPAGFLIWALTDKLWRIFASGKENA